MKPGNNVRSSPRNNAAAFSKPLNSVRGTMALRAPELNPDESLNNNIHSGVNATRLPDNQSELRSNIQRFLHKLAKLPEHVMSYFYNPFIRYAARTV
jgi:hypothetical protein